MRQILERIIPKSLYKWFFILSFMCISIALVWAFDLMLSGIFGTAATPGSFSTSGNAGQILITSWSEPCDPIIGTGQLCYDSTSQLFSGWIFAETIGWVQFGVAGYPITAILPTDINSLAPWTLTGYAWSDNAGWITLGCLSDCSYSGVAYIPNSTVSFTGIAWSDTLGYIEFTAGSPDFTNKVKVIGSTAGGSAWSVNYDIGNTYDTVKLAPFMSQVRQNVALLTRNAGANVVNTIPSTTKELGNLRYYKLTGQTIRIIDGAFSNIDSIIVEWGDIEIVDDIARDTTRPPKSIIAIQNSSGSGGNIFIKDSVKNIYSTLIAEWSVYSGEDPTKLYNDTRAKIANLPKNQLYIYGNLFSRNTIGWALRDTPSCPYTEIDCTYDIAIRYDINYFRSYDKTAIRKSDPTGYDAYSMIIERDPQAIINPPPGMKNIK